MSFWAALLHQSGRKETQIFPRRALEEPPPTRGIPVHLHTQIHKYRNTQIHKYTNIEIHKYTNIQIHKYTNLDIKNTQNISIPTAGSCRSTTKRHFCAFAHMSFTELQYLCLRLYFVFLHKYYLYCGGLNYIRIWADAPSGEGRSKRIHVARPRPRVLHSLNLETNPLS